MRWIATLVATCLVVVGAARDPRPERTRDQRGPALDDASLVIAKLLPRRPTALGSDLRSERLQPYVTPVAPELVVPTRRALLGAHATPSSRIVPTHLARTSRGPPFGSSTGIAHSS